MTINVALKCADGVVLGTDSLMTLSEGDERVLLPFHDKLFQLGDWPIGVMINGKVSTPVTTVKELITGFPQTPASRQLSQEDYRLVDVAESLLAHIYGDVANYLEPGEQLEVIVAGFSHDGSHRFGEVYSLTLNPLLREAKPLPLYTHDDKFGLYYGGAREPLDRFIYGFSPSLLGLMRGPRRDELFKRTAAYVIERLRDMGVDIPANTEVPVPSGAALIKYDETFDLVRVISDYQRPENVFQLPQAMLEGSLVRYKFPEREFSLQMAIGLCQFLMMCAYVLHNYTMRLPEVGSEMTMATVTREAGFQYVLRWKPRGIGSSVLF